jgi:hypothetical protein
LPFTGDGDAQHFRLGDCDCVVLLGHGVSLQHIVGAEVSVDGWTWSVDQVPITVKVIALAVGKWVSGVVGGYREFVHGLVQMLHLPHLPQYLYDALGVVTFSIGRGHWIGRQIWERIKNRPVTTFPPRGLDRLFIKTTMATRARPFAVMAPLFAPLPSVFWVFTWIIIFIFEALVYGSLVAIVIATLFGIDYVYRHFA